VLVIFSLLLCWVVVSCGFYKGSYDVSNISYLNSPPLALFYPPLPDSWNSFNRYHFCIYIHVYTLFPLYSAFYLLSCHLPLPTVRIDTIKSTNNNKCWQGCVGRGKEPSCTAGGNVN
jgi:hypothetical protein